MKSPAEALRRHATPLAAGIAALLLLLAPVGADAATVTGPTVEKVGNKLVLKDLTGSSSVANEVFISLSTLGTNPRFGFQETGPSIILPDSGCRLETNIGDLVTCPAEGITQIDVRTFGKNDRIDVQQTGNNAVQIRMDIDGGDGEDVLEAGAAGDKLIGGAGDDTLSAGPGDDDVFGNGADDVMNGQDGDDNLDGGPGADVFNGGAGTDRADYLNSDTPVRVAIGDGPNDGGVDDELSGASAGSGLRPAAISFLGINLPDFSKLTGGGDDVKADIERVLVPSPASGTSGSDVTGDESAEEFTGGNGNDRLEGKAGADTLRAGAGDDTLFTRDGAPDAVISCGGGTDRALVDRDDFVDDDCEDVDRGAANADGPGFDDPPGGADDQGEGDLPGGGGGGEGGANPLPPELAVVGAQAPVSKKGSALLRIRCVYLAANCVGTVKLVAARKVDTRIRRRKVTIKKGETLGSAAVNIPWGTSEPVAIKLKSKVLGVLKVRGRTGIAAKADVRARDSGAGATAPEARINASVLVSQPGKKKKKKKK